MEVPLHVRDLIERIRRRWRSLRRPTEPAWARIIREKAGL
jgi:hypothetical protein